MKIRWTRILRGLLFGLVISALMVNFGLAWIYVGALTRPACGSEPAQLPASLAPERVTLPTLDGHRIEAWYYPSQNGRAVIALGGLGGALGDNLPPVTPLIEAGYGVLQVGTRACADPPAAVTLGYQEGQDVVYALDFLLKRPEIVPGKIGAFGFSMGGAAAIRAAARHSEIAAVVAEGGYHNLGEDIVESDNRPPFWSRAFLYTIAGTYWARTGINPWESSPVDDLPLISPRPVLLIYGEHEVLDGRAYTQFEAARDPKELWVVPGGGHGTNHLAAPEAYPARVVSFFNARLQ